MKKKLRSALTLAALVLTTTLTAYASQAQNVSSSDDSGLRECEKLAAGFIYSDDQDNARNRCLDKFLPSDISPRQCEELASTFVYSDSHDRAEQRCLDKFLKDSVGLLDLPQGESPLAATNEGKNSEAVELSENTQRISVNTAE